LTSPSAGDLALKYGDINAVTPSPGEAKGLIPEPSNFALMLSQAYAPSLSSIPMRPPTPNFLNYFFKNF